MGERYKSAGPENDRRQNNVENARPGKWRAWLENVDACK